MDLIDERSDLGGGYIYSDVKGIFRPPVLLADRSHRPSNLSNWRRVREAAHWLQKSRSNIFLPQRSLSGSRKSYQNARAFGYHKEMIEELEHGEFGRCLKISNSEAEVMVSLDFGPGPTVRIGWRRTALVGIRNGCRTDWHLETIGGHPCACAANCRWPKHRLMTRSISGQGRVLASFMRSAMLPVSKAVYLAAEESGSGSRSI